MQNDYDQLEQKYNDLQNDYDDLQNDYDDLQGSYYELEKKLIDCNTFNKNMRQAIDDYCSDYDFWGPTNFFTKSSYNHLKTYRY